MVLKEIIDHPRGINTAFIRFLGVIEATKSLYLNIGVRKILRKHIESTFKILRYRNINPLLCFILVKQVSFKFGKLRTSYFSYLKKNNAGTIIHWKYFSQMKFLSSEESLSETPLENDLTDLVEDAQGAEENNPGIINIESPMNKDGENQWSFHDEVTLIDFYKEHPSLFDIKSSDYKKSFKSSILEELGVMLDMKFTRKAKIN